MIRKWRFKLLGDISHIAYGYTEKASFREIGPKFLRITDIQDNNVDWESVPYCIANEIDYEKYKLNDGDIVFARTGATTGKSFLVRNPPKSVFASYLIKVHINNGDLLPEFLYLYFQTNKYWDTINIGISGSAQGGFNAKKLSQIRIPLPSLSEQKRIVKILNQAFAAIDQAKANAERNLQNSRELFDAYLNKVFANPGDGWEEKKLEEIVTITSSKRIYKSEYTQSGIPFYRTKEIKEMANNENITTELFISESRYSEIKRRFGVPQKGDVLVTAIGTIGEIHVVENEDPFYFKDGNVLWFKNPQFVAPYFLKLILMAFVENLKRLSHGSAYNALPIERLKNHRIHFPKITEQRKIISKLESISTQSKKLETNYYKKLKTLEELKKSILQKAFDGKL